MSGEQLQQLAQPARALADHAGGDQVVVISITTLLLIIIVVLLVAD
jgi:c-di-AMP phosphodiesterase-like protein